jgi:hypothetical protein
MKIYGEGVYQNERADLVGLGYIVYAIERVEDSIKWLGTSEDTLQFVLAELDMLITLGEKFPKDINVKLKKSRIKFWQECFYAWYEKNCMKIPKQYREATKKNADEIFSKLGKYGHSLDWL